MTQRHSGPHRLRRYTIEAVPNNHGQYQAEFRIHLDGALPANDEVHFGEAFDDPALALDEGRAIAARYLKKSG